MAYPEYPHGHCVFLHSRIFTLLSQNQRRRPPPLPQPGYGPEFTLFEKGNVCTHAVKLWPTDKGVPGIP